MDKADNIEDIYELAPLQQGMLFHCLYEPTLGLYLEQISIPFNAAVNVLAFERSWQQVIDRHTALRTSIHWEDMSKPLQVVHRRVQVPVDRIDWWSVPRAELPDRLAAFLQADRTRGLELSEAPLLRLTLIRLAYDNYQLILTFHHAVLDGWSLHLVLRDFEACYEAACRGRIVGLGPVRPYGDYVAWLQQQDMPKAEAFWRQELHGFSAPTILPLGRDATAQPGGNGGDPRLGHSDTRYPEAEIRLSRATTDALRDLAKLSQLTLNTITQAAWAILLSRYSGQEDVVFGAVVSGRPAGLSGVESMVGLFINILPVRAQPRPNLPLLAFMRDLRDRQFEARLYDYSPLMVVQGWTEVPRGTPLYESALVFENYPVAQARPGSAGSETRGAGQGSEDADSFAGDELADPLAGRCLERTNLPLTITIVPGSRLLLKILFDRQRFDRPVVERILAHFATLLENIGSGDIGRMISEISLLSGDEEARLLQWSASGGTREDWAEAAVVGRFEAQAVQTPDAPAFLCERTQLNYAELDRRANRLARHLRSVGVVRGTRVGICLQRSLDVPVALLATFKAGGIYVPLDPAYPRPRLDHMLEDAGVSVLVTRSPLTDGLACQKVRIVCLDADGEAIGRAEITSPAVEVDPADLAYVIYTSGSTGKPKGVAVEHRQLQNRLAWMWRDYPFAPTEVACQKTALNFVDSLWELLGALLQGIPTIIIPDEEVRDPAALVRCLAAHRVTRIWGVPSLYRALLDTHDDLRARLPALNFWVTTGEAVSPALFETFRQRMPGSNLYNLYGTSEVWDATWYDPGEEGPGGKGRKAAGPGARVPIGKPIPNVTVYVLDRHGQPAPIGVPGELHVGGLGLGREYLNRPDLTAERFLLHRVSSQPPARLYRTGDLARWRSDGELECLGRIDRQVKLRGYRVEPGEIEAALGRHPDVRSAAVVPGESPNGGPRLIGYVVRRNAIEPALLEKSLRAFLVSELPEPMIPSCWVMVSALPLTPSGKIDRRALSALPLEPRDAPARSAAPAGAVEQTLAALFVEVLGVERVGRHDHFFAELGGHSLLATQLVSRARNAFSIELPLRSLFEAPTVAALAMEIERIGEADANVPQSPHIKRAVRSGRRVRISRIGDLNVLQGGAEDNGVGQEAEP